MIFTEWNKIFIRVMRLNIGVDGGSINVYAVSDSDKREFIATIRYESHLKLILGQIRAENPGKEVIIIRDHDVTSS